ncbi:hypothetical protein [Martelella radicis]|uniref:Uncharacterized protein n=1 Tax=Martelella radicis TaxID=1397476 RepID=A0A7W6PB46_9HYPH|nr:hypothetical protein [Martelella radicis]MBB4123520.1 hypothetical protein [Martelella radicis]
MRYQQIDDVLDFISDEFEGGAGGNYKNILSNELYGISEHEKELIDNFLNFGATSHFFQRDRTIEKNNNKIQIIKSILLAYYLFSQRGISQLEVIKSRISGCSVSELIRIFRSRLPPVVGFNDRRAWNPSSMTDPRSLVAFQRFRPELSELTLPSPSFRFIVHGCNWSYIEQFKNTLKYDKDDILSTSLISNTRFYTYRTFGVIFKVPENNILVTSITDAGVHNRAQSVLKRVDTGSRTATEEILTLSDRWGGIVSPEAILHGTFRGAYNEIVITGRENVPLSHGCTGKLEVVGLFLVLDSAGQPIRLFHDPPGDYPRLREIVEEKARREGLPLIYLPRQRRG